MVDFISLSLTAICSAGLLMWWWRKHVNNLEPDSRERRMRTVLGAPYVESGSTARVLPGIDEVLAGMEGSGICSDCRGRRGEHVADCRFMNELNESILDAKRNCL